jgi:hypothetical protein
LGKTRNVLNQIEKSNFVNSLGAPMDAISGVFGLGAIHRRRCAQLEFRRRQTI